MNNFDLTKININSLSVLTGINFTFKFGFLVADAFLIIFLLIVLKQILSMDHIIHDSNDFSYIKTFTLVLMLIAISLFIVCLVIL